MGDEEYFGIHEEELVSADFKGNRILPSSIPATPKLSATAA